MGTKRSLVRRIAANTVAASAAFVVVASCGDDEVRDQSVSALVGPGGANVTGPGGVQLAIPPGAVASDFTLTVSTVARAAPPSGNAAMATPLRLTPKSQGFSQPVSITIPLTTSVPAGRAITDVVILQGDFGTSSFSPLVTQPAGPRGDAVTATVLSLGDFVAVLPSGGVVPMLDGGMNGVDGGVVGPRFQPGDGVVLDTATSLLWQSVDSPAVTHAEAAQVCATLVLGPPVTWRLPTLSEYGALFDRGSQTGLLDPSFMVTTLGAHHTSTPLAGSGTGELWRVDAESGAPSFGAPADLLGFRCVTGTDTSAIPMVTDQGNGLVLDPGAGVYYQAAPAVSQGDYITAANACRGLSLGGFSGFSVPTLSQMLRIVDYASRNPAVDQTLFTGIQQAAYWTSTTDPATDGFWVVDMASGAVSSLDSLTTTPYVLCVYGGAGEVP